MCPQIPHGLSAERNHTVHASITNEAADAKINKKNITVVKFIPTINPNATCTNTGAGT